MKRSLISILFWGMVIVMAFVLTISSNSSAVAYSDTTLLPGDIVVIGMSGDTLPGGGGTGKSLTFVPLIDLEEGTTINFTDSGWIETSFRANEGGATYTTPAGGIAAGTVISAAGTTDATWAANGPEWTAPPEGVGTSGMNFSTGGDQILVFTGDASSPTLIFAVNGASQIFSDPLNVTNSSRTALPAGLTQGVNAVAVGAGTGDEDEYDNVYYAGITTGTKAEVLAAVANPVNWIGDNANYAPYTEDFTVIGGGLSISKSSDPSVIDYHENVTFTISLKNPSAVNETGVMVTDTLPAGTTFARWVPGQQPAGSDFNQDELTWTGDILAGESITFSFVISHTGDYGDLITNTAVFSGSAVTGDADAAFAVQVFEEPKIVINEFLADPAGDITGDANGDGTRDSSQDEFVELVNATGEELDLSGWTLNDAVGLKHTFPAGTVIPDTCSVVIFGGGSPTGSFGGSVVQTASGGNLGLNNTADTITLYNLSAKAVISYTYGAEGSYDQSLTRDPDITGPEPLISHTLATGANGALFSPGTMIDGSVFSGCPEVENDLSISKSGPSSVLGAADEELVYTIRIDNQGFVASSGIVVTDTLPDFTAYAGDDSGVIPANPDSGIYAWSLPDIPPMTVSSFVLTLTLETDPSGAELLTNTIEVAADLVGDDPDNNSDKWETDVIPLVPIHDIQYTADPGGDSPYKGKGVATEGIVTAVLGDYVFIQDAPGGWNGVLLYRPNGSLAQGDYVRVVGTISEYNNLTEFSAGASTTVISAGNSLPAFQVLPTGDVAQEQYESVLVRVENAVVTNEDLDHGEWYLDDGSGNARVDDMGGYDYVPLEGQWLSYVQGPVNFSYNNFMIEPRDNDDIQVKELSLGKEAVAFVDPGETLTYTLMVENNLGLDLTGLVVTDTVPANAELARILDGGMDTGGVVSWTLPALNNGGTASFRMVVTATDSLRGAIVNDDYAVGASNYLTPTFGKAVYTFIGGFRIYQVQGTGAASPYLDQEVTIPGVVVADFQTADEMDGFFMQDAAGDGNPLTSDGIFVYDPGGVDVTVGDLVEVTGLVDEYYGLTQIDTVSKITILGNGNAIQPTQVILPEATQGDLERYEGMLVTIPHTMTVQQNYFQGQYGQVTLASGGRLANPTNIYQPGSQVAIDLADENARRMLILDDGSSDSNPDPVPYLGDDNTLRAGDVVEANLTGVLDYGRINSSSPAANDYRLQPTGLVTITRANQRTAVPDDVGGRLRAASLNVLNYFNGDGQGGGFPTSRGADTLEEFNRQRTKIITAVLAIDADVIGLMEIENDGYGQYSAIQDLVNGLNAIAGAGTYAFVDPGIPVIGTDEIAVGTIYRPGTVTPAGAAAILDSTFDPAYKDGYNRPALAQTFEENTTGARFTTVVNHLKSKGSACDDIGDPDTGDGQGNCNLTRTAAITVEITWLATDPTGSGDPDVIILGDLNSYAMEDPIRAARDAGYTDLHQKYIGLEDYSYIFDGFSGYLDHFLANESMTAQVKGATTWHINADEPAVLDYNTEHNPPALYAPTPYRASDHDPVIIGFSPISARIYLPLVVRN